METSVTHDGTPCINKGIQYRMHPENIDAITAARINVCSLANNHILDWGMNGLYETLDTLNIEHIAHAGAGQNIQQAQAPATLFERKKFKLNYANDEDCQWLLNSLQKHSTPLNTNFKLRKNVIYL